MLSNEAKQEIIKYKSLFQQNKIFDTISEIYTDTIDDQEDLYIEVITFLYNKLNKDYFKGRNHTLLYEFDGFTGTIQDLIIPRNIKIINDSTFEHSHFKSVVLMGVKEIRTNAFYGSKIGCLALPDTLKIITGDTFDDFKGTIRCSQKIKDLIMEKDLYLDFHSEIEWDITN